MHRHTGFTLPELLIVVAIASLLMTIGTPNLVHLVQVNRGATLINSLLGDLRFARAAAVQRGTWVSTCASANSTTDAPDCAKTNKTAWHQGWIVFHDVNGNRVRDPDEPVLRAHGPVSENQQLVGNGGVGAIRYSRVGFSSNATTIRLYPDGDDSDLQGCLVVSMAGRLTSRAPGENTCTASR